MFHLLEKHPIFNRYRLWSVSLVLTALVLPLAIAKSKPPEPPAVVSSPIPSPQPTLEQPNPERERQRYLFRQSLSLGQRPTTPKPTATKNPGSKTATAQSPKPKAPASARKQRQPQTPPPARTVPALEIRVAIADGVSSLVVGTSTPSVVQDGNGRTIGNLAATKGTTVVPEGQTIRVGALQAPAGVWVKPTKGGYVFVGDNWYRGDVLLVSQGDSLLAVNYVDLEVYLAGVVGSEMPASWPTEALKAQAIAARSYALVHYLRPANALYDLGNTQRWQVYKGINGEWNTTSQAVRETAGIFLSYKGGVVESMYAASDAIVSNVFGGTGMSQEGANDLAQQGYTYQQILGTYYPGVGLSWIDGKASDAN